MNANLPARRCQQLLAASSGKVANYGVCNPSLTPLADTYSGGSLCNTCFYDKFSQFWISTDGGATAIVVSSQLFRAFATYTMTVGASFSITGVLTYNGPANGGAAQWSLTPRDLNDVTGLTVLSVGGASVYPPALIGDASNGVKQQQYQWASPGPTLASNLDSGVVGAESRVRVVEVAKDCQRKACLDFALHRSRVRGCVELLRKHVGVDCARAANTKNDAQNPQDRRLDTVARPTQDQGALPRVATQRGRHDVH